MFYIFDPTICLSSVLVLYSSKLNLFQSPRLGWGKTELVWLMGEAGSGSLHTSLFLALHGAPWDGPCCYLISAHASFSLTWCQIPFFEPVFLVFGVFEPIPSYKGIVSKYSPYNRLSMEKFWDWSAWTLIFAGSLEASLTLGPWPGFWRMGRTRRQTSLHPTFINSNISVFSLQHTQDQVPKIPFNFLGFYIHSVTTGPEGVLALKACKEKVVSLNVVVQFCRHFRFR